VPLVNRIALLDIAPPLIALCVRLMASHRCVPTIDSAALSIDSTVQSLVGTVLSIGNNHTDMHNCLQHSSVGLSITLLVDCCANKRSFNSAAQSTDGANR